MNRAKKLREILEHLKGKQFTGRIDIENTKGKQWRLYFCLSRFIWADGGYHSDRAWQRLLNHCFPNLDYKLIDLNQAKQFECWNYYIIVTLLQRFLITKEQAIQLINTRVIEIIFDIYQQENQTNLTYKFMTIQVNFLAELGFKVSVTLLKIESIRADVEQIWEYWQGKGLGKWSPNCAPLIKNNLLFKQELNDNTYKRLVSLLNGKYTLRELGYKLKLDDIKIMTWLKPYVEKGLIDLIEVKDIPLKVTLMGVTNKDNKITQPTQPRLIACVDDSLQICQIMQHIVTKAGYKYIAVQDPLKALPIILRHKPDLIFLDLIMPILNGYEICTQIRRVSGLKDVPIVILTSNDGMVDRLRSKIVGASAFLGKPIDEEKVVDKINSLLISASRKEKYSSSVKT